MKRILLILAVSFLAVSTIQAQKFAYVDTDYISNNIPEFNQAQDKLDEISKQWQEEIEAKIPEENPDFEAWQEDPVWKRNRGR